MQADHASTHPATAPIGVFDSGIGGLSVLRALQAELPHERFVYVADSGHAPYGERDSAHVLARSEAITRWQLAQYRIKALVIACNTATAVAVQALRAAHPALPVVGVEPAVKPAAALSTTKRVGVLATRGTLGSAKFQTLLASLAGQATFHCQPCDGLADALERGDAARTAALCAQHMQALGATGTAAGQIDTVVLGCTHYPFAQALLQPLAPAGVHWLESGEPVARQTRRVLAQRELLARPGAGGVQFFTTGAAPGLATAVSRWLGTGGAVGQPEVASLSIPDPAG